MYALPLQKVFDKTRDTLRISGKIKCIFPGKIDLKIQIEDETAIEFNFDGLSIFFQNFSVFAGTEKLKEFKFLKEEDNLLQIIFRTKDSVETVNSFEKKELTDLAVFLWSLNHHDIDFKKFMERASYLRTINILEIGVKNSGITANINPYHLIYASFIPLLRQAFTDPLLIYEKELSERIKVLVTKRGIQSIDNVIPGREYFYAKIANFDGHYIFSFDSLIDSIKDKSIKKLERVQRVVYLLYNIESEEIRPIAKKRKLDRRNSIGGGFLAYGRTSSLK